MSKKVHSDGGKTEKYSGIDFVMIVGKLWHAKLTPPYFFQNFVTWEKRSRNCYTLTHLPLLTGIGAISSIYMPPLRGPAGLYTIRWSKHNFKASEFCSSKTADVSFYMLCSGAHVKNYSINLWDELKAGSLWHWRCCGDCIFISTLKVDAHYSPDRKLKSFLSRFKPFGKFIHRVWYTFTETIIYSFLFLIVLQLWTWVAFSHWKTHAREVQPYTFEEVQHIERAYS